MFTLSIGARSLFTLSAFLLTIGSPGAATDRPALSDAGAADQERPVVAPPDRPQESQRRRTPPSVRGRARPGSGEFDDAGPAGPSPVVRFEAAVYRLALSVEDAVRIDAASLAQVASLVEFDEALRALGDAQVLYRVDQMVDLRQRERIRIAADLPYASSFSKIKDGQALRSVHRQNVGAEFDFSGDWVGADRSERVHLSLGVKVSALESSQVAVGPDVTAPMFRTVDQRHCGPVQLGRPVVLLNLDGACTDNAGRAVAFVTRAVLRSTAP